MADTRVSILNAHHCMPHNLYRGSEYICLDIFQNVFEAYIMKILLNSCSFYNRDPTTNVSSVSPAWS